MATALPPIGIGTSRPDDDGQSVESVRTALEVGYRHVDTAQLYENEAAVGEAIAAAPVDREDVVVATKVAPGNLAREDVVETAAASLERLRLDAIDLLYVHWPTEAYDPAGTLAAFDELVERGDVRHVGLSNCNPEQLREATDRLDAPVLAHQVECHPLLPQRELRALADDLGHRLVAHSPLARGAVLEHPTIVDVAEDRGVSPAQVTLAWLRERGVHAIPRATSRAHVEDNYASLSLDLDDEALDRIDAIEDRRRVVDFEGAPWDLA